MILGLGRLRSGSLGSQTGHEHEPVFGHVLVSLPLSRPTLNSGSADKPYLVQLSRDDGFVLAPNLSACYLDRFFHFYRRCLLGEQVVAAQQQLFRFFQEKGV